jgi:hypothetical protein
MAYKDLAGEIQAETAVLQAPLRDTALKEGTVATPGTAQLIGTATAAVHLVGVTPSTVTAADSGQATTLAGTFDHRWTVTLTGPGVL